MATLTKRSTIYFEPSIHKLLKMKAIENECSVSELVNEAILQELAEDAEDLRAIEDRRKEPTVSFETLVKKLKADGKI